MNSKDVLATFVLAAIVGIFFFASLHLNAPVYAQTNGAYPPLTNMAQTRPQAIPTSATDVIKQDAYICYVDLQGTGQLISVLDRQASPVTWLINTLGTGGSTTTWIFNAFGSPDSPGCRWMPGGFTIQAGSTGATGYFIMKCPTRCLLNWGF